MIVLQLTSDYIPNPLWGMGWHVKFLTEELRKKGIKVYVGTANKSKNIDKMIITTSKNTDKLYLSDKPYEIFKNFKNFLTWQKCLGVEITKKKITPDIIHCHNWMSWLSTMEIKKKNPKAKLISTFHLLQRQYETMLENPIPTYHKDIIKIENEMLLNSDCIILQSYSQLKLIKSKYGWFKDYDKIKVIPSGVKFISQKFEEIHKKKLSNPFIEIIFAGRIEKDKGIYQTLEAFSKLSKKYRNIRLHVLGKGSKLSELSSKFNSDKIIFHGFVDRNTLIKILKKSHIFCLPSSSESFGNSIIEAMIFGVVPIFSKGESVPTLFEENFHGLNISLKIKKRKYRAKTEDIAKKMELLINNQKLLYEFSRKVYNFSRSTYSIENMAQKVLNVYKGIL